MIANPTERYSFFMNSTEVISIQQKSRSEISDISRAQCNDPTRPDPSHLAFGYYSCKQDTKERYWGQQFCP